MCNFDERIWGSTPPSDSWMTPLVEDMLCDARTGLTEAVMTGSGTAVLFYGRHSMGKSLTTDKARDAAVPLTAAGTWVGKLAYLAADPMTIQEGRRAIAQAVSNHQVKVRGPGCSHVNLPAQQPFQFDPPRSSPPKDVSGDCGPNHLLSPCWSSRGQECNRHWRDQRPQSPQYPSPSPDCGFKRDWSLLLMASLMSSRSDQSDGSRYSRQDRWIQERRSSNEDKSPHLQGQRCQRCSNLPELKVGFDGVSMCRDHTLLPYAIRSLQGYPRELVWSSGMDITLGNVLTILDEHYSNVKALDALNQEVFQLQMADKETVSDWGICLSRHLQVLAASFPDCFTPDRVAELKRDHFYGRLPK